MGTGPVQVTVDRVARAVHEVLAEPRRANHGARGVVECRASHYCSLFPAIAEQRDGGITSATHGLPYLANFSTRLASRERHPGLIRKDTARRHACPQIEQQHVARGETAIAARPRLVMRVGGVRLEADDRRMVGDQPGAPERLHHARLQRRLAHLGTPPASQLAARPAQRRQRDLRDRFGGSAMTRQLAGRPARREAGDQRPRRHDLRTEPLDQLDDAMRYAIEIRHRVARRDLHGDGLAGNERTQLLVQLAPRRIGPYVAGESVEGPELDTMCDRHRRALARQQYKEAPRPHPVDAEDTGGGGIDAVEVVEQPAVGAQFAEQLAQGGKIELVEGGRHWCRGSGPAARHSHPALPRARQATCSMAPSYPTSRRSSSTSPAP